ncbi:hypothetical protein WA1_10910 [Scytonema hofmannii PCC 7110]|uniref:Aquaporin Z n=1 Tax=Scytonema hofmannii PCC 7110 TaxID=128403 RepID=A0A139XFW0_9CYAN|nr:hypothetical protein WA1_10910 [Scytonema hofmannii PCC 7110]
MTVAPPLVKRCLAEFIGTFWLVLGGCGSAVLAAAYTADAARIAESTKFPLGIGLVGVSLAFGLTVITVRSLIFEGREELIPDWVRFQYDYGSAKTSPCNTWGSREGLTV